MSATSPVAEPDAALLTLMPSEAQAMSPEQRLARLDLACFSGKCDEETFRVLVANAGSAAERSKLRTFRDGYQTRVARRARTLLAELQTLERNGHYSPSAGECTRLSQDRLRKVDAVAKEVEAMLFTPGGMDMWFATNAIRYCVSTCTKPNNERCKNAQLLLAEASSDIQRAGATRAK